MIDESNHTPNSPDAAGDAPGSTRAMPPRPLSEQVKTAPRSHWAHGGGTTGSPDAAAAGTRFKSDQQPAADGDGPRRGRAALIALAVVVGVVAVAYAAGAVAFNFLFYPNATVCGVDVSLADAATAKERVEAGSEGYSLTVSGDGFEWSFSPEDGEPVFDTDRAVEATLAENDSLLWPVHLYEALSGSEGDDEAAVDLSAEPDRSLMSDSFDGEAFEQALGAAVDEFNANRTGTFDAPSAYDAEAGAFTPERARENEKLDRDNVIRLAWIALSQMDATASLEDIGADAYEPLSGGITDDQLEAACEAANGLLGTEVTFKLGESDAGTLNGETIAQWIVFDESLTPSLNADAVTAWAHELAGKMNTVGTQRTYTRPDGKEVTVSGGTFGWTVDEEALVAAVQTAVTEKQTGEIAVPTTTQGDVYNGAGQRDWGAWVEVDRTEQMARYYDADGNLLWESGVITGNPLRGNETPTGVYKVNNKHRHITLVSRYTNPETGEPNYETPVDYWIAFIGSSYGFHDADWQRASNFGSPGADRRVGSHGCVNTPHDKVAELYEMLEPGTCVIIHD